MMKIYLHNSYSGRMTNEQILSRGEHTISEKVGRYLIDNGHAILVDDGEEDILEANEIIDDDDEDEGNEAQQATSEADEDAPKVNRRRRRRS